MGRPCTNDFMMSRHMTSIAYDDMLCGWVKMSQSISRASLKLSFAITVTVVCHVQVILMGTQAAIERIILIRNGIYIYMT